MKRVDGFQERIVYVDGDSVSCSGENNDHPKVYLRIPTTVVMLFVVIVI